MYFLSFVIFFWLYVIITIYNLTTLCVHDILSFMFKFIFKFVFIFHIIFMFHEHIYTYCISCSYLHPFLPCIPINFNQAISTLCTTIQFSDKMWHQMPLNSIWLDSRLNEISIESKNTHNGVLTKELCKLQVVAKISNLQHLQQQQQPSSFVIFGDLNFTFDTGSLYSFEAKVLRVLLQLESSKSEDRNSSYVLNNPNYSMIKTEPEIGLNIAPL